MEPKAGQFPDITKEIAEVAYLNNWHHAPALLRFLQEIFATFYRFLFDLVHSFKLTAMAIGKSESTAALVEAAIIVIFCLLALIIAYVLWPRIVAQRHGLNSALADEGSIKAVDSSGTLKQKAGKFALDNNFDLAIKSSYLSALRRLHEQNIVPYLSVATNFEYCNLLTKYPEVRACFRQIADCEEFISFGLGKATKSDFDRCFLCLAKFEELLGKMVEAATAEKTSTED